MIFQVFSFSLGAPESTRGTNQEKAYKKYQALLAIILMANK